VNDKNKRYGYYEFTATLGGDYKILIDGKKVKSL
jgi:hypothetical protein